MNKIFYSILIIFVVIPTIGLAQDNDFGETRLFYRSEIYGGFIQHTNGWGIGISKARRIDGYNKLMFSCDLVSMKHNKEIKQLSSNLSMVQRYTYGKINSFTIIRPSIGKQKIVFTKDVLRGVEISTNWAIGASIGYSKPVYLKIATPDVYSSKQITQERYDPTKHFHNNIAGRGSFLKGLTEGSFYPGIYAKFGVGFEYAANDDKIRYIETGVTFDGHYREVPIMAFADNQQFFVAYYVKYFFGKKNI